MSVPRVVLAGIESGPAVDLAAGALLAGLGKRRSVRPVLLGLDMPLWRLLYNGPGKAPRVIDPALHSPALAGELFDHWTQSVDFAVVVSARPALDRWEGVDGSRPIDSARRFDAPLLIVMDARERGATAAAAVLGVRSLAGQTDIGGLIVVGADDSSAGRELVATLRRDVGITILGFIPPQLSEQFARQRQIALPGSRTIGAKPPADALTRLCEEAASYLQLDEIEAIGSRRGYVPSPPRRLFGRDGATAAVTLAVAWGPPLLPLGLENIDVLKSLGVELAPLNISRDASLPEGAQGLLVAGQIDEDQLGVFAGNRALSTELTRAVAGGLPTLALGGGALLLLRRLADSRGRSHELAGVIPAEAEVIEWYERPRYVRVTATRANAFDEGDNVLCELFDVEYLTLEQESFAYRVRGEGESAQAEGFAVHRCLATSLYPSFALCPAMADRFVAAMARIGAGQ